MGGKSWMDQSQSRPSFRTYVNVPFFKAFAPCHLFSSLLSLARVRSYLPDNRFNVGGHLKKAATDSVYKKLLKWGRQKGSIYFLADCMMNS